MNIGKAQAVFEQIRSDKYSETEKLQAIWTVLEMATHFFSSIGWEIRGR